MDKRERMLASARNYMQNDGLITYKRNGCEYAWATLFTVRTHFDAKTLTRDDVITLILEAREMFGECERSNVYRELKANFPEAFE